MHRPLKYQWLDEACTDEIGSKLDNNDHGKYGLLVPYRTHLDTFNPSERAIWYAE